MESFRTIGLWATIDRGSTSRRKKIAEDIRNYRAKGIDYTVEFGEVTSHQGVDWEEPYRKEGDEQPS